MQNADNEMKKLATTEVAPRAPVGANESIPALRSNSVRIVIS